MVFAENGLWGLSMTMGSSFNAESPMPSMLKEVWPHEGRPDPWLEANDETDEELENDAAHEQKDWAA